MKRLVMLVLILAMAVYVFAGCTATENVATNKVVIENTIGEFTVVDKDIDVYGRYGGHKTAAYIFVIESETISAVVDVKYDTYVQMNVDDTISGFIEKDDSLGDCYFVIDGTNSEYYVFDYVIK